MNKIFCALVAFIFSIQSFGTNTFDERTQIYSHLQLEEYVNSFDPNNYVVKSKKILDEYFVTRADKDYIKKMSADLVPLKHAKLSFGANNEIVFSSDEIKHLVFSEFNAKKGSFRINGAAFHLNPHESLQAATERMAKLISMPPKVSLYNLFIPRAEAVVGLIVGFIVMAILVGIPLLMVALNYDAANRNLNEILGECQGRDPKVPFEQSKLYARLEQLKISPDLQTLQETPTCQDWEKAKHFDDSPEAHQNAGAFCVMARQISMCIKDYKAGKPPEALTSIGGTNPIPANPPRNAQ